MWYSSTVLLKHVLSSLNHIHCIKQIRKNPCNYTRHFFTRRNFTQSWIYFTQALLVMLVTNIKSVTSCMTCIYLFHGVCLVFPTSVQWTRLYFVPSASASAAWPHASNRPTNHISYLSCFSIFICLVLNLIFVLFSKSYFVPTASASAVWPRAANRPKDYVPYLSCFKLDMCLVLNSIFV